MDGACGTSLVVHPLNPKSPPRSLDLYGKRRQLVKVQVLEREVGLLQEELKFIEDLQPVSRCCKELDDFIGAKPDPFIATTQDIHKSHPFWKRLCLPWICCFSFCQLHLEIPNCCTCCSSVNSKCLRCCCYCLEKTTCQKRCKSMRVSCPHCACCCFKSFSCNCTEVNRCSNCEKICYNPCCL